MTPDERELRRALDARSGSLSPDFRNRLSAALAEDKPTSNLMPALALVAAIVLVFASVGVLLLARNARNLPPPGPAISTPTPTSVRGILTKPSGPIPMPDSAQLSAPSGDVVWVLVANQYLFRSTDYGKTWEQRPVPPSEGRLPRSEISFVSQSEGWLTTGADPMLQLNPDPCQMDPTVLWHTTDAGMNWREVGTKIVPDAGCKDSLSFVDSSRGFLVASDASGPSMIYRTTDGGHVWNASPPLPDPPGLKAQAGGSALKAGFVRQFGSTFLVAVTGPQVQLVYSSNDGGATWSYAAKAPIPDGTLGLVTASQWLLIGPGQSFETTNGGASWHRYSSEYSQAAPIAPQIVFAGPRVGYATVRGGIQRTTDGGYLWVYLYTPGT
jgi:photosystem II stability/assembly factor-like uncharacterized protein